MIIWPIATAQAAGLFDEIVVSTEDKEIAAIATEAGARVIRRPEAMATDEAHELEAVDHVLKVLAVENYRPDAFCILYPTAAFLEADDLVNAHNALDRAPSADVVMAVTGFPIHPFKALTTNDAGYLEMMFPVQCRQRSQTYPHVTASCGAFYWMRTESFARNPTYYPDKLRGYELPAERAVDIDTLEDLKRAQALKSITQ